MLVPRADGLVEAARPVALPLMAARLQGELAPDGALSLSLWGAGALGRVRLAPFEGPVVYGPNRLQAAGGAGLWMAQSAPAILIRGAKLKGISQARRPSPWGGRSNLSGNSNRAACHV